MPGTDICLKIGGYVRAETTYHSNGNFGAGPTGGDLNNRTTNEFVMRARAYITADAREQTAWGTARAYVAVGVATTDVGNSLTPSILGFNRAFIQWAGITAGITQSFYDFYSAAAVGYRAYLPSSDTGDAGWWLWAYTAQLGNGLSASISAEQRRTSQILGFTGGTAAVASTPVFLNGSLVIGTQTAGTLGGYGGLQSPDIVGNIRLDQTWGSAQIMAAAHEVNPVYYGTSGTAALPTTGHAGDEWGWVAGAGLRVNFPFIAQGDYFQAQVNYTQGGLRYLMHGDNAPNWGWERGNEIGFGLTSDCVFGAFAAPPGGPIIGGTGCNLTTAWGINASYEHYWTPQFHESFVGNYMEVRYNDQANAILCTAIGNGNGLDGGGSFARAAPGCDMNWNEWTVATRLQYDFTKTLYFGVEFLYSHLDTATLHNNVIPSGNVLLPTANGCTPTPGVVGFGCAIKDMNNLAVTARIHKDFLP
jgi:hypothetical protein